jgi:16S rRNA (guanine966-N2)-methyltransferase
MRIIAGLYRGRVLKSSRALALRPTSDRLRETLFNVLSPRIPGAVFVDLYAGTGAIGIEALSRGAARVCFIEENSAAARVLQENLKLLGARDGADVVKAEAGAGIRSLARRGVRADICFVDPPYTTPSEYDRSMRILSQTGLMAPEGLVIMQHSRKQALDGNIGDWQRVRLLEQGSNALSFYKRAAAE